MRIVYSLKEVGLIISKMVGVMAGVKESIKAGF